MDRRAFLAASSLAALGLAGCGGGGGGATRPTRTASGQTGATALPGAPDDAATLTYALKLAQVESDLYRRAVGTGFFTGGERDLLRRFGEQEDEHVATLTGALGKAGGRAPAAPQTKLPLQDRHSVLATALRLENLGAAAYLGQVGRIRDRGVLATLLSIHTVEARHGATLGLILGKPATPDGAFARPENMATVLRVLDLYTA